MIDDIELTREVAELTRDVERLDSFIDIQRYLLEQRTPSDENAKRHWKQIRTGLRRITTRTREILDEISQPNPRGGYAIGWPSVEGDISTLAVSAPSLNIGAGQSRCHWDFPTG
jgi:hypothetical protein